MMGEITSVAKNAKSFASLRTTIPISMVRQWKLKPKDKLYWEWEVRDG
ncbi:MAG: AbrB family transcriptional regulator [Candidatus Nitrosopolaris sp.]